MTRRICVVTGTRAEYGLLKWVIDGIRKSDRLNLQLLVTGMHLSPEFGFTFREIVDDGHTIDAKVEMLLSADTATGISKSMGLGMIGFGDAFERLKPDLIILLGDRFEAFSAAAAALVANIPLAHLHGGETTEGAFDESLRHSITKMSHLHFVAAEEYQRRVIQLGEQPERVFLVGGLGVDAIKRTSLLERSELETSIGFRFGQKNLLVTFHPVTLEGNRAEDQMAELLAALELLDDTQIIFTMPNADNGSRSIIRMLEGFVARKPNAKAYPSLGQVRYLSCLRQVDGVIGNSSSGLAEAPSLGIGTVNIGDRQRGRLKATSVIDCPPQREAIRSAIHTLYSPSFRRNLTKVVNPYGHGGASEKIVQILQDIPLEGLLKKTFYDVPGISSRISQ